MADPLMPHYRQIAEKALGKPLPKGAVVHHANGIDSDNRPCNLVICQDQAYHQFLHKRMRDRGIKPTTAAYLLRDIDDDLWRRAKARAKQEGRPLRWVVLRLITLYSERGLDAIERKD